MGLDNEMTANQGALLTKLNNILKKHLKKSRDGGWGGELETYQLLSTNKAAQRSPFLAVYEPGSGGLVLNSA